MSFFRNILLVFLLSLVVLSNAKAASLEEKVVGLYVAFFDRAGDKNGLEYWKTQANALGEDTAIKTLASGFATHEKFTSLYGNLSNQEYVESIYTNLLGQAGDSEGVEYWRNLIATAISRPDMVAEFVSASLDFDRTDPKWADYASEDLDKADQRKNLIANKVEVALHFIETLGENTNLDASTDPNNPSSLDADAAYKASINILSNITHDETTKNTAKSLLGNLIGNSTLANDIINVIVEQYGSITDNATTIQEVLELVNNAVDNSGNVNLGSYDIVYIYKNIAQGTIDALTTGYQSYNNFYFESVDASKSCTDYGYSTVSLDNTVLGVRTKAYFGSTYGKGCYEVDYAGSQYQTGTGSFVAVWNN